jgi:hypothetical protein
MRWTAAVRAAWTALRLPILISAVLLIVTDEATVLANTYVVDHTNDNPDCVYDFIPQCPEGSSPSPPEAGCPADFCLGDGVCRGIAANQGGAILIVGCSLRGAVIEANHHEGPDVIDLTQLPEILPGLAQVFIQRENQGRTDEAEGDLDITDDLRITGNGPVFAQDTPATHIIGLRDCEPIDTSEVNVIGDRVFEIHEGAEVTFSGLKIGFGLARGERGGGGIRIARGDVVLEDIFVQENESEGRGGGIEIVDGSLTIDAESEIRQNRSGRRAAVELDAEGKPRRCVIELDAPEGSGGGIFSEATVTITNSRVFANDAAAEGGGIANLNGSLTIENGSNIELNESLESGGGIFNDGTVTVTGSNVHQNVSIGSGAGVFNRGTLTINDSTVSLNITTEADGGGIFSAGASSMTEIFRGLVQDNRTRDGNGGGIFSEGIVVVDDSTLFRNTADNRTGAAGTRGLGGGLFSIGNVLMIRSVVGHNVAEGGGGLGSVGGTLTIAESTVNQNESQSFWGGGILSIGDPGAFLSLTNATVSGNTALAGNFDGGGISLQGDGAAAMLKQATIYDNAAPSAAGGGLDLSLGATATLVNTLIAGNRDRFRQPDVSVDDASTLVSQDGNLIGNGDGLGSGFEPQPNDQIGKRTEPDPIDPLLRELEWLEQIKDDGEVTQTLVHVPIYDPREDVQSPAIDRAVNATCTPKDQLGLERPMDGDENGIAVCNIGAVEMVPEPSRLVLLGSGLSAVAGLAGLRRRR